VVSPKSPERVSDLLRDACDRALAVLPPGKQRDVVAGVRERLAEDLLRIAVGGRMNAGKSTLVNALLGQSLAATDATECTRLVSWFKYGTVGLVRLHFTDGTHRDLREQKLAQAVAAAGRPASQIGIVEVLSSNDVLRSRYTILDTPGLDSLTGLDDMSLDAFSKADVLIYLMPHPGAVDKDAFDRLGANIAAAGITAVNTIGVLSQVDRLGDSEQDPWAEARKTIRRSMGTFGAVMSGIIPVHGLLAATALGSAFSESDMPPLRKLAATDRYDEEVADALRYHDKFLTSDALPLSAGERKRLLGMLGLYGIGAALDAIEGGAQGATKLLAELRRASRIDDLLGQLDQRFVPLADGLRARVAIQALDAVSWTGGDPATTAALTALRADLDALKGHLKLRQLDLKLSLAELNAGKWTAPEPAAESLAALAASADVASQAGLEPGASLAEVRAALIARIADWRRIENTSGRAAARHARVVREYLESLYSAAG
jgi:hypothetical protein